MVWILKMTWKLVILLTFLHWFYLCILKVHTICKIIHKCNKKNDNGIWNVKKDNKNTPV
jgi:hypothetical protein